MLTNLSQTILKDLDPRLRDIIERRFGLKNVNKEPLESIGKDYKITKERVRQLEENAIFQIERNLTSEVFDFFKLSENHLKLFGGIRKEDQFLSELIYLLDEKTSQLNFNILNFLLSFDKNLKLIPQNKSHFSFWTNDVNYSEQVLKFINGFYKYLQTKQKSLAISDLEKTVEELAPKYNLGNVPNGILVSYLSLSKLLKFNPFGYFGTIKMKEIAPTNSGEKALMLFKNVNKPLHFKEVANYLNSEIHQDIYFYPGWQKKVNPQTVHNELIKNKDFVLIGRGVYALKKWGYEPGTVKDIIIDILSKSKKPLSYKEISEKVLKVRQVKPMTIFVNLQNKEYFRKLPNKTYTLVEKIGKIEQI